jgi:isocitrate dehydrogenase
LTQDRTIQIPFIPGDGIGPEIMTATRKVIDAAISKSYAGSVTIDWSELLAGEAGHRSTGEWLPRATIESISKAGIAIKGPLTTPVGGGFRSLNVTLRQTLDLYASVRPIRYFEGIPSPVKDPHLVNLVIFRENTEDVYKGLEWKRGSAEAQKIMEFLRESLGVELSEDTGLGLKPISESASKRLVRAAIRYAISNECPSVTLVHKGNIMKFTEGAFRDWGYELARDEFREQILLESEIKDASATNDRVIIKDRIADNMFQQVLTRPSEYSVLATPNLNGDYLADACAAQVGGLGFAPGANIGDKVAVFEPVHGTAPKYAGKNIANPSALMLSGALMLDHLGLKQASQVIVGAIGKSIIEGAVTDDVARIKGISKGIGTSEFADEVVRRL